jgi:hypothetical protein
MLQDEKMCQFLLRALQFSWHTCTQSRGFKKIVKLTSHVVAAKQRNIVVEGQLQHMSIE